MSLCVPWFYILVYKKNLLYNSSLTCVSVLVCCCDLKMVWYHSNSVAAAKLCLVCWDPVLWTSFFHALFRQKRLSPGDTSKQTELVPSFLIVLTFNMLSEVWHVGGFLYISKHCIPWGKCAGTSTPGKIGKCLEGSICESSFSLPHSLVYFFKIYVQQQLLLKELWSCFSLLALHQRTPEGSRPAKWQIFCFYRGLHTCWLSVTQFIYKCLNLDVKPMKAIFTYVYLQIYGLPLIKLLKPWLLLGFKILGIIGRIDSLHLNHICSRFFWLMLLLFCHILRISFENQYWSLFI